jgi:hypothetical protein
VGLPSRDKNRAETDKTDCYQKQFIYCAEEAEAKQKLRKQIQN